MGKNTHAKIGKWGGGGGNANDVSKTPKQLLSVTITADANGIRSIYFRYTASDGSTCTDGWGDNTAGTTYKIDLCSCGESITEIYGTTGNYSTSNSTIMVKSLKFVTNKGNQYGPYGCTSGDTFSAQVLNGGTIEGFHGRSGGCFLDAIGVYVDPK
ncbi:unnamed protein product [Urochloa decumbens]|uniref:Jacalin-type lectin domain-containing protein n=1 Tax=Urochloa decumbens TaxID=240449 RepID=A0ABC9H6I6_9POAL